MTGFNWEDGTQWGDGSTWGIGEPSTPEDLAATEAGDDAVDLSWTLVGNADAVRIYRARSESPDLTEYSLVGEIPAAESHIDTGLTNGREYHYRVTAVNAVGESDPSNDAAATTDLPAPTITGLTADVRGEILVDYALSDDNDEGSVTIRRDGIGVDTTADLTRTSYMDAGLLDGEQYAYSIFRDTGDASVEGDAATVVTVLPPVQDLTLSNGIVDEIEASWDPGSINNGSFEVEFEDDEDPGYLAHATLDESISSTVIGQLLDGQLYRVRVRTTTEFATTDWVVDDIVTAFPAVTDVTVTSTTETTASIAWTDNSDNERGQIVLRQQLVDGEWWALRSVGSVEPDQESFVDDSVAPNRTVRYAIGTFTNYASTESDPSAAAETGEIDVETDAAPADGWRIEIDREDGKTVVPELRDDPQAQPQINGFPSLRVSTTPDEFWQGTEWDEAPIRAWRDGKRQPIDVLEHRDLSTGEMTFEARGGTELDQRVVVRSDPVEPVAEFVDRLITDETGHKAVVDSVEKQIRDNVLLQLAATQAELQSALEEIPADIPLAWDGDTLIALQTAYLVEAEDTSGQQVVSDDTYSGGEGSAFLSESDSLSFTVDIPYEMAEPEVVYREEQTRDSVDVNIRIDGDLIGGTTGSSGLNWDSSSAGFSLSPGEHTVTFDVAGTVGDNPEVVFDVVGLLDGRYAYTFDNKVHEPGGALDGPEPIPDLVRLLLERIDTPLAVAEATLSAATTDNSGVELALRDDGVGNFVAETDSLSTTLIYDTLEATVQGRVGVGRRDDLEPRDETPRLGYESQALDGLELRADLDETPVLINRTFDDKLVDILQEAMQVYDGAFEVREGDPTEIHVSRIDGRPVDIDPELVDYSIDRSTEGAVDRAVVYAASQAIRRLSFSATVGEWTQLPLGDGRIVEGSETVFDATDDESLDRADDYEIREVVIDGPPEIKLLTSVDEPRIDCDFKPRGEHETADLPDSPKEIVEDAPELNSQQMADLAAFQAVEGSYTDAVIDATIELPPGELGFEVLDALNVADLPRDEPYQVQDIDMSTDRIRVRLGAGKTAGEVVQDINRKTGRVSERV